MQLLSVMDTYKTQTNYHIVFLVRVALRRLESFVIYIFVNSFHEKQ